MADLTPIQKRIAQIEKLQEELKTKKEMIKNELENELEFVEAMEEAKESAAKKKRLRDEVMARGSNQKIQAEIKEEAEELKMLKEILSVELAQVFKEKDTDEVTDADGETRKFQLVAKLMPKGKTWDSRDAFGKYTEAQGN